jgi:hypothetical protein
MFIHAADPAQSEFWSAHSPDDDIFRIAILSTPRAGSTWLRRLLNSVYSMPQVVLDNPIHVDWEQLPNRCIMQLHWKCDPALLFTLKQRGFRLLTMCRHPLDILVSILHFSSVNPNTASWLDGRGGDERAIAQATPCSAQFLDYALSMRADILLSVSRHWKTVEDCRMVRYEELVHEPAARLTSVCDWLRPAPAEAIDYAIQANTLEKQRQGNANQHFWRGQPDQWKRLLPARPARKIAAQHQDLFQALGYVCDPDRKLTTAQADANWHALELASLKEECRMARSQLLRIERDLRGDRFAELQAKLDQSQSQCDQLRAQIDELRAAFADVQTQVSHASARSAA